MRFEIQLIKIWDFNDLDMNLISIKAIAKHFLLTIVANNNRAEPWASAESVRRQTTGCGKNSTSIQY